MLYNPPTGAASANDPYVGKNTTTGTQGSKIPPAAVEFPQREIVAVLAEAGVAPTNTDLKQMMRAIRSGKLSVYQDTGTPNALIATSITAHTSYVPGMPLCFKLANDITGATTLNIDGLGVLPVTFPGGGPLQRFDFLTGDLIWGRVNSAGTGFIVLSPISGALIDTAIVRSVHGAGAAFADLNQAFAWLNRRRVAATGSVTFQLAAGVNANRLVYAADINVSHPDGARVAIQGQPLTGALPAGSSLTYTGYGTAARLSDTTTNLAVLRNVYSTEIFFTAGKGFKITGAIGNVQDILATSDGTGNSTAFYFSNPFGSFTRCAAVGAAGSGLGVAGGVLNVVGTCYALGCASNGFSASLGGQITLLNGAVAVAMSNSVNGVQAYGASIGNSDGLSGAVYARGNAGEGLFATLCSTIQVSSGAVARDNASNGFSASSTSTIRAIGCLSSGNGGSGFQAANMSFLDATSTTGTGNGSYGYFAFNGSQLTRPSGTATGGTAAASPAAGSGGNNDAYMV